MIQLYGPLTYLTMAGSMLEHNIGGQKNNMYGIQGSTNTVKNPFTQNSSSSQGANNNPFSQNEDKTGFNPAQLFNSGTVGLQQGNPELEKRTIGIG